MEKDYIRKAVGANLKRIRDHRNVTQRSAANFLGMSESNYGKIERGTLRIHSEDLMLLAKHWNVTVQEFYSGVHEEGERLADHFERQDLKKQIHGMVDETEDIETLRALSHVLRGQRARRRGRS